MLIARSPFRTGTWSVRCCIFSPVELGREGEDGSTYREPLRGLQARTRDGSRARNAAWLSFRSPPRGTAHPERPGPAVVWGASIRGANDRLLLQLKSRLLVRRVRTKLALRRQNLLEGGPDRLRRPSGREDPGGKKRWTEFCQQEARSLRRPSCYQKPAASRRFSNPFAAMQQRMLNAVAAIPTGRRLRKGKRPIAR